MPFVSQKFPFRQHSVRLGAPLPEAEEETIEKTRTIHVPRFHVILWDDNDHTYEYVIEMLMKLFGHRRETAFQMAVEVDTSGRVVVDTTTKERAELKRDQIHAYGADWRISHCKGSMSATIEPADDSEA